jgi:HSP20 family protein
MADIVRRDAWEGLPSFTNMRQLMDRLFDESGFRMPSAGRAWDDGTLDVDISEKDHQLIVRASVPGFAKDDIDVQVHQGVLSINAKQSEESEDRSETFYRRERRYGALNRRIALPGIVHDAPVDAELKDGVLTLKIQVPEQARPKQIEIKSAAA